MTGSDVPDPQFDSFFRRPGSESESPSYEPSSYQPESPPDHLRTEVLPPFDHAAAPPADGGPELLDDAPEDADLRALLDAHAGPAVPRGTQALLAGLALVAAFAGGVLVERHEAPARAATAVSFARAGGLAQGGFGGARSGFGAGQGTPGSAQGGSFGGSSVSGARNSGGSGPAVIGTVVSVSGRRVTVRNFAGKNVTVTVPDGTPVAESRTLNLATLKAGTTVSVTGSTSASGDVTATGVIARTGG